eukprot:4083198-Prymnesium_polylepis.1
MPVRLLRTVVDTARNTHTLLFYRGGLPLILPLLTGARADITAHKAQDTQPTGSGRHAPQVRRVTHTERSRTRA